MGKKKDDSEKEPAWFGPLSSAVLIPVHKPCCNWKRWSEREKTGIPVIHLASLCCCLGPMVTSEIEDEHERELQRNPFTDSQKSAPNYSESKYQLKQAASPFSLLFRVHDLLRKQGQNGMRVKPAAIWVHLWRIEHGTYANSAGFLARAARIPAQPRLYLECAVVAVKQNSWRCCRWYWEPGFSLDITLPGWPGRAELKQVGGWKQSIPMQAGGLNLKVSQKLWSSIRNKLWWIENKLWHREHLLGWIIIPGLFFFFKSS